MFTPSQVGRFFELPSPLLTAYMRTGPNEAYLHGPTTASIPWLKDESRKIAARLTKAEQAPFVKQMERVEQFLQNRTPHEKSLVIFAGPDVWETVALPAEIQNELRWGNPAVSQLMWLVSEHKPYGLVVVDHAGARFFHYWCGEIVEHEGKKFDIDTSQWKNKELGHVTGQGIRKTRGTQRDVFKKRMDNRYAQLCDETAQQAANLCERLQLAAVFLVGPERLIKPIKAKVPRSFRQPVVLFGEDLARVSPSEILRHLEPQIANLEREREAQLISAVTNGARGTVAGLDEALAQLQKGKVRTVVVARALDPILHECVQCGWTDRGADLGCPICGGDRRRVALRNVLPVLARRNQAEIEVLSNRTAQRLLKAGGMAAWLRQPKGAVARSGR